MPTRTAARRPAGSKRPASRGRSDYPIGNLVGAQPIMSATTAFSSWWEAARNRAHGAAGSAGEAGPARTCTDGRGERAALSHDALARARVALVRSRDALALGYSKLFSSTSS